jgi:hypothetical protein
MTEYSYKRVLENARAKQDDSAESRGIILLPALGPKADTKSGTHYKGYALHQPHYFA